MKISIKAGTTSKLLDVFIMDSSSTTGAGLTGLAYNTASLTAYYYREGAASAVAITLATMTLGTWATGGFVVVDGTNMPGCYQLGVPDAAFAAGAKSVIIMLKGATNMAPLVLEVELTATDNQDAVRGGMTALPNANAEAAGGLFTRGSGAGQVNQSANGQLDVNLSTIKSQTITCAAGVTVLASVGTASASTAQTGDSFTRLGAPVGASISADIALVQADTDNIQTRIPAALTADGNIKADTLRVSGALQTAGDLAAMLTIIDDYLDTEIAQILGDTTTDIPTQIAALNNLSAAQVNAEVVDALNVDTYAEPGQSSPAATLSLIAKVNYLYAWARNRKTNDGTTTKMYADDGTTVNWKQTTSESGGTVEKAEIVSGP